MRILLSVLLIAVFSFIAGIYLPWWSIAVVAFIVTIGIRQSPGAGFVSGFLGIFLLWGGLAFWIDAENKSLLSQKVATLLKLGDSSVALILVTALVGALVGGFAGMSGASLRAGRKVKAY